METASMYEKLAQRIQSVHYNQYGFDPAQFNDPIALQTGWMRASPGGSSFRTFKLVEVNPSRVEFKTTFGAVLFSLIFIVLGTGLTTLLIRYSNWASPGAETIIPLFIGLIFAAVGGYLLYRQMLPIVFDKREGLFWRKHKPVSVLRLEDATENCARLEHIHALQIVAEFISGKNAGYFSFELNLVLKNGKRINIIDHSKKEKLDRDARLLANFLKIPIWDATL